MLCMELCECYVNVHSAHDERLVAVVTGGERARARVHGPGENLAAIHGADRSGRVTYPAAWKPPWASSSDRWESRMLATPTRLCRETKPTQSIIINTCIAHRHGVTDFNISTP